MINGQVIMSNFNQQSQTQNTPAMEAELDEPGMYQIVLHNDDYTTMEFVVYVLERVFNKNTAEANHIMLEVHRRGRGVCGVYPFEIAETKVTQVEKLTLKEGFPLKCTMEPV